MSEPTDTSIAPRGVAPDAEIQEMADSIRDASAVVDYGDWHGDYGAPPLRDGVRVAAPSGHIRHETRDMYVSVSAGTTLGDLQDALAQADQWLPLDGVPLDMTLGEAVAHNVTGPLRAGYGGWSERLLGLRFLDGRGRLITVGGQTVKNVAGYDLTRLMVGNANTLGLLVDLNLRTEAIPPHTRVMTGPLIDDRHLTELLVSEGRPVSVAGECDADGERRLRLVFHGTETEIDAQQAAALRWFSDHGPTESVHVETDPTPVTPPLRRDASGLARLCLPVGHLDSFLVALGTLPPGWRVTHPTHGVAYLGGGWSGERADAFENRLLPKLTDHGGERVWLRCPASFSPDPIIAPTPTSLPAMRAVKAALDPDHRLNPNRLWPDA